MQFIYLKESAGFFRWFIVFFCAQITPGLLYDLPSEVDCLLISFLQQPRVVLLLGLVSGAYLLQAF